MPEVPTTDALAQLYRRIGELEADIRLIDSTVAHLERIVLNKPPQSDPKESRDHWKEIGQEVEADLFAEYLQNPPDEDE